jgi:hypothetical protein
VEVVGDGEGKGEGESNRDKRSRERAWEQRLQISDTRFAHKLLPHIPSKLAGGKYTFLYISSAFGPLERINIESDKYLVVVHRRYFTQVCIVRNDVRRAACSTLKRACRKDEDEDEINVCTQ